MRKTYKRLNEHIAPPEDLKKNVFAKLEAPKRRWYAHPIAAMAAMLLVVLLATPVMAAYVPSIQELMFQVAPDIAARFSPIQESDVENGIRMEVVSASIHGSTAELYFSFQDLEGNRLDENTHINSHHLSRKPVLFGGRGGSWGSIADHLRLDEETGIYYSMINSKYNMPSRDEGRNLTVKELCGNKITVTVDSLQRNFEAVGIEVPITMTEPTLRTINKGEDGIFQFDTILDLFPGEPGGIGMEGGDDMGWFDRNSYTFVAPGEIVYEITPNLAVTNMCYLDGELHIQLRSQRKLETTSDQFHEQYFEAADGNRVSVHRAFVLYYQQDGYQIDYTDMIFQIPEEELANYRFVCDITEYEIIEGPWRVTFPLVESDYEDGEDGKPYPIVDHESTPGTVHGEISFG